MLTSGKAIADGAVYPGNLDKPIYLSLEKNMDGHLVQACRDYMEAVSNMRHAGRSSSEQDLRDKVAMARRELVKRVEMFPDEINDTHWGHYELVASPLYAAVYGNDSNLVKLMLDKGALPFLPDYCFSDLELSRDVKSLLAQARSRYDILEICLQAREAGIDIEERSLPHRRLCERKGMMAQELESVANLDDITDVTIAGEKVAPDDAKRFVSELRQCLTEKSFGVVAADRDSAVCRYIWPAPVALRDSRGKSLEFAMPYPTNVLRYYLGNDIIEICLSEACADMMRGYIKDSEALPRMRTHAQDASREKRD